MSRTNRYCSLENPKQFHQKRLWSLKIAVWCAMPSMEITAFYFSDNQNIIRILEASFWERICFHKFQNYKASQISATTNCIRELEVK